MFARFISDPKANTRTFIFSIIRSRMFLPFISNAKRKHPTFIFSAIRSRLCLRRRFHHGFLLHICWEKFIHEENAATWKKSAGKKKKKKSIFPPFFSSSFCSCWGAPYIQDFTVRTRNRAPRHIMNFHPKLWILRESIMNFDYQMLGGLIIILVMYSTLYMWIYIKIWWNY